MRLIISLLVYNQLEVTKKCIESILENTTGDFLLIISDNASREDTQEYLSSIKHPKIKYIRNEENLGFIKAHNNIFNSTNSEYFCVLNNDIIIKTKGWDDIFIGHLEENFKLAQIGPKQAYGYLGEDGRGKPRRNNPIDYIEGSCFIAVRGYVKDAGGLFENKYMGFAFCEDSDLSLRLRNNGYKIAECHSVNVLHFHHQSFKHEKVEVDYKKQEQINNAFLRSRWNKYLSTRKFEPMKILVDRHGAIGDVLCLSAVIEELKNKYPCSKIYVNTHCPQPFLNNPFVEEYGKYLKHKYKYDLMIDLNLAYEKSPREHIVDAYAKKAKVVLGDKIPKYYGIDKSNIEKRKGTIVVCSDNTWKNRMLDLNKWKEFVQHINKTHEIIEVGVHPQNYLGIGENYIGKIPFEKTIELIYSADMFCGMDSGLFHFAQAVGTPVFVVFGCINPEYRIHDWDKATVIHLNKDELSCSGCHHEEPFPRTYTECTKDKIYCVENITVEKLIEKFERRNNCE